jgi:creatinine amidohydrolase
MSGSREVLMQRMTWQEYVERLEKDAIVVLPIGSLEQHGPHLPLDTDALIARGIATKLAERRNALVAPTVTYAAKSQAMSGGGQIFPGTTSLAGETLIHVVRDIVRGLIHHGVGRLMILNGHGENSAFIYEGVDLALMEPEYTAEVLVVNWWQLVSEKTLDKVFPTGFPGWDLEHGAVTETSLVHRLAPELVREEKLVDETLAFVPPYAIFPQPDDLVPTSGLLSQASGASAGKGEMLVEEILAGLVEIVDREWRDAGAPPSTHKP